MAVCFVAVFLGVGASLNDHWEVATVRTLPAAPALVQQKIVDLKGWRDWNTTDAQLGPNTKRTVEGEPGKAGSLIRWQGSQGESTLKLTAVTPQQIDYEFELVGRGVLGSGSISLAPDGNGTRVTWRDRGTNATLVARWVAWFGAVQDAVRKQQEASLGTLSQRLEAAAK